MEKSIIRTLGLLLLGFMGGSLVWQIQRSQTVVTAQSNPSTWSAREYYIT